MAIGISNSNSDFTLDIRVIRSMLEMSKESREQLMFALDNCSDEARQELLKLIAIADNPKSKDDDKASARATIYEALKFQVSEEAFGVNLSGIERADVGSSPETDRISQQIDSQEDQFARKLRELMKAKGLTQMELARRSECTQPAISQMLNRKCRPQKRTILKLAAALDVEPTDLWPDLDVTDILDTIAAVQTDDEHLSAEEAAAIERAVQSEAPGTAGKPLPKLKR